MINKINTNSDNVDETIKQIKDELENLSKRINESTENNKKFKEEILKAFNEVIEEVKILISNMEEIINEAQINKEAKNNFYAASCSILTFLALIPIILV